MRFALLIGYFVILGSGVIMLIPIADTSGSPKPGLAAFAGAVAAVLVTLAGAGRGIEFPDSYADLEAIAEDAVNVDWIASGTGAAVGFIVLLVVQPFDQLSLAGWSALAGLLGFATVFGAQAVLLRQSYARLAFSAVCGLLLGALLQLAFMGNFSAAAPAAVGLLTTGSSEGGERHGC